MSISNKTNIYKLYFNSHLCRYRNLNYSPIKNYVYPIFIVNCIKNIFHPLNLCSDDLNLFQYKLFYSDTNVGNVEILKRVVLTWEDEFGAVLQFRPNKMSHEIITSSNINGICFIMTNYD